jgi:pimeloyl-ACP methyl ester carboxylesterase
VKVKTILMWVFLSLILCFSTGFAADIRPADLIRPVPEFSGIIGSQGGSVYADTKAAVTIESVQSQQPEKISLQDYTPWVKEIQLTEPDSPPSILGAVRIFSGEKETELLVTVPLIIPMNAGTQLDVVTPNFTGTAWAETNLSAAVREDGLSAEFKTKQPGAYAIYNPEREQYLSIRSRSQAGISGNEISQEQPELWERGSARKENARKADWGLHSENEQSPDKIPLILLHGDNSYKEDDDRWGDFLDWVSDHSDFDKKYEIWRFHHDTRELIGFDGKSGNAAEFGDAVNKQFGSGRAILLLAHSRGGLVSRAYMCKYGDGNEGDRVIGLVTLGTPHHGSPGAVPDWGLHTAEGKFKDTELADILYGYDDDSTVNVADIGTMGLAWDNFDGPDCGVPYVRFSMESSLGDDHVLSLMDMNLKHPVLKESEEDTTIYVPDRAYGTLEELNSDTRYFGKIIVYGGYDTELGAGGHDPFNWLNFSFTDHAGLEIATHVMAEMESKQEGQTKPVLHFFANDGMVPLQSALLLKKDSAKEPIYDVEEEDNWFLPDSYKVDLKDFSGRLQVRRAVLCPDYDHLHMIEGRGGLLYDKSDYWDHVASSLDELSENPSDDFSPELVEISDSLPSFSSVVSGDNCFIQTVLSK